MASFDTIHRGGEERILACLPRTVGVGQLFKVFADQFPVLKRDQLRPMTTNAQIRDYVDRQRAWSFDLDQNGAGACGAFSAAETVHQCDHYAGGLVEPRAAGRLYLYSGHGEDNGSTLSDNLKYAVQYGIPVKESREQEMDYQSPWTEHEKLTAKTGKILAACDCPDFDSMLTALDRGWAVQHGLNCGRNYDVDDTGLWIGRPRGSSGGHAQCSVPCGVCYVNGEWGLLTHGSWSSSFGYFGYYVIPEAYFAPADFTDGWACRFVVAGGDDPAPPKEL
jgi:hypothetical protein